MKASSDVRERLKFLRRVVDKEIKHLDYAASQAFDTPLTYDAVEKLDTTLELALRIEAFTSRFCRLQDTLGDKLLPALLKALEPFLSTWKRLRNTAGWNPQSNGLRSGSYAIR